MDTASPVNDSMNRKSRLPMSDEEGQCMLQSPRRALDVGSVLSGGSAKSKVTVKEDRGITCADVKAILPTAFILLFTLFIMVTVIPYAFSSVIKQLQAVSDLEAAKEVIKQLQAVREEEASKEAELAASLEQQNQT